MKQKIKYSKFFFFLNAKNKTLGLPSCPSRRIRASVLISKSVPTHLYEFPLGILVRVREARNHPYSGVPDFKVVAVLKATTKTIEEVHVMVGES